MKTTLEAMIVPVGGEPYPKTLEADEHGSFLRALQECVGGHIEPMATCSTMPRPSTATRRASSREADAARIAQSTRPRRWRMLAT